MAHPHQALGRPWGWHRDCCGGSGRPGIGISSATGATGLGAEHGGRRGVGRLNRLTQRFCGRLVPLPPLFVPPPEFLVELLPLLREDLFMI